MTGSARDESAPWPSVPTSGTGRADLVRCLTEQGDDALRTMARCLGLTEQAPAPPTAKITLSPDVRTRVERSALSEGVQQDARFWRVVRIEHFDTAEAEARRQERRDAQTHIRPLTADELYGRRTAGARRARVPMPWHTWADYGQGLHRALARKTGLGTVDIDAVLACITRCEYVDPLPRYFTLGVENTIWVWLDRTLSHRPYWSEQLQLVDELMRFYGDRSIRWIDLPEGPDINDIESIEHLLRPGDLSLAVSEFVDADAWMVFGRALAHRRQRTLSFSFTHASAPVPWTGVRPGGRRSPDATDVDRVLAWLAYTGLFDAGHLRAVCRQLGLGPEAEFAVWMDPRVRRGNTGFAWIDASAVVTTRSAFHALDKVDRQAAIELQAAWRAHHGEEVVAEEYLALRAQKMLALMPGDLRQRAEDFWRRLAATARMLPQGHSDRKSVQDWVRRVEANVDSDVFTGQDDVGHALQQLWWAACRDKEASLPNGLDIQVASAYDPPAEPSPYILRTHGDEVWSEPSEDPYSMRTEGSWLVTVTAKTPVGRLAALVPSWADDGGTDTHGRWAAFEVAGVRQVMRWIAPGRFEMGSPESDEEGFGDERPQHTVTLSDGYWLAETPCTQALWRAVMDNNPSDFDGDDRPVENVSHDDATTFLQRIEALRPGLQSACRRKPNGSTPPGLVRAPRDTASSTRLLGTTRMQAAKRIRFAKSSPTPGASTTCSATSGSGVRTAPRERAVAPMNSDARTVRTPSLIQF